MMRTCRHCGIHYDPARKTRGYVWECNECAQDTERLSPHQVPGMAVMSDYDSTSDHFAARQGIEAHR